jgi:hypothetical protein
VFQDLLLVLKKKTGRVDDLPRSGRPSVSEETIENVKSALETHSNTNAHGFCSLQTVSRETNVPKSTVHKIMKQTLKLKPYRVHRVQELKDVDLESRVTFANWFLERSMGDENFFHLFYGQTRLIFTLMAVCSPVIVSYGLIPILTRQHQQHCILKK